MSGHHDGEPPRPRWRAGGGPDGGPGGEDILDHGPDRPASTWWPTLRRRLPAARRPSRAAAVLAAAGLVVGLGAGLTIGYTAGDHHGRGAAPTLSAGALSQAAQLAVGGAPVGQGPACATWVGSHLQLGFQVTNVSSAAVTLRRVRAILPMGGLKAVASAWGPCGELPQPGATTTPTLSPGASTWFTVTFQVLVRCPGPMAVQFALGYVQGGRAASAHLPGFNDLSQVRDPGCA
jgi:hypothetical protein